ncbi:hypothetical protein ACFWN2_10770 [Lentzea sp. NPDC058436]|uniref:hypothetical protein n=1 Tax=Lentzea sp. NPDC058436 TaxID=3346499 RepID=UPI0036600B4E
MRATELLRELAMATVDAPEPPGAGRYHYVHTRGSNLRTNRILTRTGESTVAGSVEQFERRQWIASDGSGRLVVTRGEEMSAPPSGVHAPGQLAGVFITAGDENSLVTELAELTSKSDDGAIVRAFRQVWNLQVVTPGLQRLLLLRLAECADLNVEEATRKFTDRSGVAVSHVDDARHRRQVLVFCQETGELIGEEGIALEGAAVPVAVPAVVSSTEWLLTGYCETTAEPPRQG